VFKNIYLTAQNILRILICRAVSMKCFVAIQDVVFLSDNDTLYFTQLLSVF